MALLVLSSPLPAAPFVEALRRAAPRLPVWADRDSAPPAAVEAILAWRMKAGVLPHYPKLRVLCSTGAGVDKLLVDDLPPGLPVTRVVDPAQGVEIAQYAVACVLGHTRDLALYAGQQARGEWLRHPVRPPARCRVGVLGMGEVGQAVARAFAPLGYPVAGWSRGGRAVPGVETYAGEAGFAPFLARSDILVCALPLTEATRGLLRRDTLSRLPPGAFVVNVGRGEQLVEADLRALLDEGHLAGAALDVFAQEPPPAGDATWAHPKVVATPHIAAQASYDVVAAQCLEALAAVRRGERPRHAVDREAGY